MKYNNEDFKRKADEALEKLENEGHKLREIAEAAENVGERIKNGFRQRY